MNRRRLLNLLLASLTLPVAFPVLALPQRLTNARAWQDAEKLRLVLDLSGPVRYKTFRLSAPDRIIIDLANTQLTGSLNGIVLKNSPVRSIRSAPFNTSDTRVVLELAQPVSLDSFLLGPAQNAGHRLVLDLKPAQVPNVPTLVDEPATVLASAPMVNRAGKGRDIIVVVDAGHGGKDPGALSARGDREKDVVLVIARNLAKMINQQKGYKARLVRNDDFFVPLRKRVEIARKYNADMFISVHADAAPRRTASGASVYALSENGATSTTARWLANRENDADLIGANEILKNKDPVLAGVLLDMSMNATISSSLDLGSRVLEHLSSVTGLHLKRVEQAGFAVLKSPDIPSILVETGFMSNDRDSQRLLDARHQRALAQSIFKGVHAYFSDRPPTGTYLSSLKEQEAG
ncbi:N-acetylmuramoyl-L-alanine amidase [Pseudomonas duriflava]|uniref:N-acetylmuramoyl-L-alanine amidase AmiC n=1 Tax=Pseudomonas duriflava TaxID=459528 RepID=A0A562QDN5_9PSED|nr:N-acetylmuramoyl-L-alanine amidase [Pseudomonas duriflava]TWI54844.1 N-acetylmuramoyl-L-alanine amidase [Pseudomonas duriflava]